jgi:DNA polymerase III delta prime subunit
MAKRGRKAKEKFSELSDDWKSDMYAANEESVRKTISQLAMNMIALEIAKASDTDLISLKEQVKAASEVYSNGRKDGVLRITFLREVLELKGVDVPSLKDFLKDAEESA